MVVKSTKQMQSNGYRLNVEDSKYLIFESKDHSKKLLKLETMAFDLIDFCEFSEMKFILLIINQLKLRVIFHFLIL